MRHLHRRCNLQFSRHRKRLVMDVQIKISSCLLLPTFFVTRLVTHILILFCK